MMSLKIRIAFLLMLGGFFTNAQVDLNQGLLAVYLFDGCTDDLTANTNDGTIAGSAGATGSTLQIPRDDSSALVLNGSFLNGLTDFTIAFQVNFTAFNLVGLPQPALNTILTGASSSQLEMLALRYNKLTNVFQIVINGTSYLVPGVVLNTGQTYCIEVIRRSGVVDLYIDNVKVGPGATITAALQISANALVIGQDQDCLGGCFVEYQSLNGSLDNLRFYDRALSEAEIAAYCASPAEADREEERTATLCFGKKVLLDVTVEGEVNATYVWTDGSTDPVFEASETGTYAAEVSYCGQRVTYTYQVSREENCPCTPQAPKAFTPNGDERNDAFLILNDCVFREFDLQIFNRWGKEVFRTENATQGWDGTLKGEAQPSDVYVYVLHYKLKESDEAFEQKGDVTLIR